MSEFEDLRKRLGEVSALASTAGILEWDQQTHMPAGGAANRAAQLEVLSKITHELSVSSKTETLLAAAEKAADGLDPDSDDAAFVRVARRDFDHASKLPTELVAEIAKVTTLAHEAWAEARAASNYSKFAPCLENIVDLVRQVADHLGHSGERYDALLDQYEPGMKAADVRAMFDAIKPTSVALVKAIVERGPDAVDDSILKRDFDEAKQEAFGEAVIKELGFDFERGRQDRAVHPFCSSFTSGDVRITTRFDKNFLPMALFGTIHETGHALYEQGVARRYDGNTLGGGTSLGVHESQSRLWENLVGRSRPFWKHFYSSLQSTFPESLSDVDAERFYRAVNKVEPSLIRVEADEVTYNLHILLRFEMETDLLEGRLSVKDAPAAWNAKMQEYFGLTPPDDAQGILQDVHWSMGSLGYFPTYSLGNIISAQLFTQAQSDLGDLSGQIERGEFAPLLGWLRENIHQWGRKYTATELLQRITGKALDTAPYLQYLSAKYGDIYGL
ncbi:carboxypeptidase M32 [Capsulimonas corticalis]|uniref:Metal-dependent carboxypeptidase n=1 Tax=Capsulimonas corticalis TaxID=2219043 RepID=A0A402CXQ1_9BACT|nr:carboxypeptidase M32 [Capsulimonas corticalis]BDI32196.1 carboxypeptidase M32 [Capsulimonas corticalis]